MTPLFRDATVARMSTTTAKLISCLLIGALIVPFVVLLVWFVWVLVRTLLSDAENERALYRDE